MTPTEFSLHSTRISQVQAVFNTRLAQFISSTGALLAERLRPTLNSLGLTRCERESVYIAIKVEAPNSSEFRQFTCSKQSDGSNLILFGSCRLTNNILISIKNHANKIK